MDGDFWIDHDDQISNLFVAAGGSGHGFKFGTFFCLTRAELMDSACDR